MGECFNMALQDEKIMKQAFQFAEFLVSLSDAVLEETIEKLEEGEDFELYEIYCAEAQRRKSTNNHSTQE